MTEKYIEQKLMAAVKDMGGIAFKFTTPGINGVPDRLVLLPHGKLVFVELKAPGKKNAALASKAKKTVGTTRVFGLLHRQH